MRFPLPSLERRYAPEAPGGATRYTLPSRLVTGQKPIEALDGPISRVGSQSYWSYYLAAKRRDYAVGVLLRSGHLRWSFDDRCRCNPDRLVGIDEVATVRLRSGWYLDDDSRSSRFIDIDALAIHSRELGQLARFIGENVVDPNVILRSTVYHISPEGGLSSQVQE